MVITAVIRLAKPNKEPRVISEHRLVAIGARPLEHLHSQCDLVVLVLLKPRTNARPSPPQNNLIATDGEN